MSTSVQFADALCCRLHRLERGDGGDFWPAAVAAEPHPVAPAAVAAAAAADSWDSALSNSPEDAAWWNSDAGFGALSGAVPVLPTDEGFLDDWTGPATYYKDDSADDLDSVSSDGSEILQMVNQLLLAFNLEVEVEAAAAATAAVEADASVEWTASNLATGFHVEAEAETDVEVADAQSDHDFSDLPLNEDCTDGDDEVFHPSVIEDVGVEADNEASTSSSSSYSASAGVADVAPPSLSPPPPPPFLATGLFRMPQEAVLEAMDFWGPLDRIRWLLWRSEPCPPRQQPQLTQPKMQPQPQPQPQLQLQPRDKSKRACSFLLKGRCRKEDCEFAHDLSRVTCKFWAAGQCFKGSGCPFLHGYAA